MKGSYKVAKKLEKLENRDKNPDSDEDDDYDCDPGEYPSLESFSSNLSDPSPASPETSLSPSAGMGTPRSAASPSVTTTGESLLLSTTMFVAVMLVAASGHWSVFFPL